MITLIAFAMCAVFARAQEVNQSEYIRIQIWAELDAFPGSFEDGSDGQAENGGADVAETPLSEQNVFQRLYGFAIERCRLIAPFLVQGMLYGWDFDYTPYDRARGVQEYWSFTSRYNPSDGTPDENRLEYQSPIVEDGKILTWVYCARTPRQQLEFKRWSSIEQPKVGGAGEASIEDGFEGIREACSAAAKQVVREYWRGRIKNKPKEVSGSILLIGEPRIYIRNGKYIADLDFLLETDNIVPYTYY